MTLDTPVSTLPFVGPKYKTLLENLGIKTVHDLLYHLPTRYLDLSKITTIEDLVADELQVITARVWDVKKIRIRGGRSMTNVMVGDDTGSIQLTWFNQTYIDQTLRAGEVYRFAGEVELKGTKYQMTNPTHELASKPMVHTGRLVPIYPQTAGVSSKWLRARIAPLLSKTADLAPEFLPQESIQRNSLSNLPDAIHDLHDPKTLDDATKARQRLAFDELLLLQLASQQRKSDWQRNRQAPQLISNSIKLETWIKALPFKLTDGQHQSLGDVLNDIKTEVPMNRLLEGDVGSGKTVVALLATLVAVEQGYQVAVMAPTSVLANQHYVTFQRLLKSLGISNLESRISLRTGKSKMEPADITIGTHALISEGVEFSNLGLVVIDEQQRFGVEQRAALMAKGGRAVHLLTMTATPIPRTLALTAFGDLDLSLLTELPSNRLPIKTHIVPDKKRDDMYGFLDQAMERGEQVYVICPLIEDSDNLTSVRAATAEFERLQKLYANRRVALLHGRMKAQDKDEVLTAFSNHEYDLLVATPVVEVGIDVPNATILVVEASERFGLAQLHQLRGRVGRGDIQSFCFLLSDAKDATDVRRLSYLETERSGIRLAELDLELRGAGELYGIRQSGIPELRAASLFDLELIEQTKAEAERLADQVSDLPNLQDQIQRTQKMVELN